MADQLLRTDAARRRAAPPPVPATTDETLMGRITQGDKLAMRALFARHQVRVYRYLLRTLRDKELAEDLVNEVFLDVWRNAPASLRSAQQLSPGF